MSKKEFILDQLAVCRNEESWMQPLSIALDGLNINDALWKPNAMSHSISEITHHLLYWNDRWLKRYKGQTLPPNLDSNAATFIQDLKLTEQQWKAHVDLIDGGLADWQMAIENSSEEQLHMGIPDFPEDAIWWQALSNLCTHNSYHIGQIIYIRKMQGSWTH